MRRSMMWQTSEWIPWERARHNVPNWVDPADDEAIIPVTSGPEYIHIIVAGRQGINFNFMMPNWGLGGRAITRPIHFPET